MGSVPLTVACVPTGIKTGVGTSPFGNNNLPQRAPSVDEELLSTLKLVSDRRMVVDDMSKNILPNQDKVKAIFRHQEVKCIGKPNTLLIRELRN